MNKNNINIRILFFMLLSIVMINTHAQTGLNFQGVARTTNNVILASQAITIKLSILQGSATGAADYTETRRVTTNAQGLFTAVIGDTGAISTLGNFTTINWKLSPKFLKIEMDASAGTNFITMGTTQFQYVAYAQFAKSVDAENIVGIVPVTLGGTGVSTIAGLKTALTLNNVNNTTDADKIISTKTQAALDLILVTATDTTRFSKRINAKADTIDLKSGLDLKLNAADTSKYTKQTYSDSALVAKQVLIDLKLNAADTSKYTKQTYLDSALVAKQVLIGLKLNAADTSKYTKQTYSDSSLLTKLKISDTAAMLSSRIARDTLSLSNRINLKANTTDGTAGLALKENISNKSTAVDLGGTSPSDILFPTQKAVKDYVTANNASGGISDGSIITIKIADGAVTDAKINTVSGSKVVGNITGNAATATLATLATTATTAGNITATSNTTLTSLQNLNTVGTITSGIWSGTAVAVEKGGTGSTTASAARTNLGLAVGSDVLAYRTFGTAANNNTVDFEVPLTFTSPLSRVTNTISIPAATTSVNGYLSSADWTTFNAKQTALTAGSGISISTGIISATGLTTSNLSSTAGITNTQLAGSIAASKLVGTDITTVGTITSGIWSGTAVAVEKGGTGAASKSAGFNALSPMSASGDIIYGGASGTGTRLVKGSNGQILSLASGLPSWVSFSLPIASTMSLGGIKVGTGLSADADGVLSLSLNSASSFIKGGVIVGNGLSADAYGLLSLNSASLSNLGGVIVGTGLSADPDGLLSLIPASSSTLGGVIVGNGLSAGTYGELILNNASAMSLGGIKVGTDLNIDDNGVLGVKIRVNSGLKKDEEGALKVNTGNGLTMDEFGALNLASSNTEINSLSNLATVGTITSGVWSGTAVAVEKGGTGLTAAGTNGQVLTSTGSGTLTWTLTSKLVSIGDVYQGGIVAYILQEGDPGFNATNQKGIIASTSDQSTGIQWYNGSYTTTGATGTSIGTGLSNTNAIIASQGATATSYAAGLARAYTGGGYTDWYLPSKDELTKMYLNIGQGATAPNTNIGGFADGLYWNSTEISLELAGLQQFVYGGFPYDVNVKSATSSYVRAVRTFSSVKSIEEGGTGATTAASARTNLGLVIGTNVQAQLVAGTDYLAPTGSAASLTNFPTFNQNTSGNAETATTAGNITATSNTTLTTLSNLTSVGTIASLTTGAITNSGKVIVGASSAATTSAILEASSTTQGFLPPRLNYYQKTQITAPVAGLTIWCSNCGASGEMQVFNGGAWTNMSGGTATGTISLNIGDSYQGGKVAYVLQSEDPGYDANTPHGLIAATSHQSTGIRWYNGSNTTTGATGTAIGTGLSNTNTIIAIQGATSTSYAAGLARAYTGGGYTDWYLPSKDELNKLYLNKNAIGSFSGFNYWSSTEYDSSLAWFQYFNSGIGQYSSAKSNTFYVRAIRAF